MNYFLVLSEINKYFQSVSSLDSKLLASAYACDNQCYNSILQILSEEIIPDYYENNYRNDTGFGRNEIKHEAERRHFEYDVIEKTNGEDGNDECEINITIYGETFVVQTDKWKNFFLDVVLGNSYHITAPEIYIDDMFDMFEELVKVKWALRGLLSIYMSVIGSSVNLEYLEDDLFFKLYSISVSSLYESYSGLLAYVYDLQYFGQEPEDVLQMIREEAYLHNEFPIQITEEYLTRCKEILDDCKRNLKVEEIASKNTAYAIVQIAAEGFPGANNIEYTCFSNGTLLLAPYRKTGAILGFVKYTELPRLNDIIRAIASFNDDNAGSLPEGFIIIK